MGRLAFLADYTSRAALPGNRENALESEPRIEVPMTSICPPPNTALNPPPNTPLNLPLTLLALLLSLAAPTSAAIAQAKAPARRSASPARPPAKPADLTEPTGPTVAIDTSMGRIVCRLYDKQAPATVANFIGLAEGSKDWKDPATDNPVHGKPFYDATALAGVSDGILGGDRLGALRGTAGPPLPAEKSGLGFDRAGRLSMARYVPPPGSPRADDQTSSSIFYVLDHADREYDKRGGTVFGQCDEPSIQVVATISHALLSVDNHPSAPVAINHISVLQPGDALPPLAAEVPLNTVTPQPAPAPSTGLPAPEPTGPTATIDTTMGTITCRLFSKEAPIAVANFIGLAGGTKAWTSATTQKPVKGKFYDGLTFRRVIPDFMVQNADKPGDPEGGAPIGIKFDNEIVPGLAFDRPGRLAYANAGPGTNSSEFFITEHPTGRLDGGYTIFGQCDDASVKVVQAIARVPRDEHNKPLVPVVIRHVNITAQ
jgi:cyclophilin family peptidyl-prolyl cis-trans isomerase